MRRAAKEENMTDAFAEFERSDKVGHDMKILDISYDLEYSGEIEIGDASKFRLNSQERISTFKALAQQNTLMPTAAYRQIRAGKSRRGVG